MKFHAIFKRGKRQLLVQGEIFPNDRGILKWNLNDAPAMRIGPAELIFEGGQVWSITVSSSKSLTRSIEGSANFVVMGKISTVEKNEAKENEFDSLTVTPVVKPKE